MEDDYELFIDDYKPDKNEIRRVINHTIENDLPATRTSNGLEIEVLSTWTDVLNNDASILYDYEKTGWKVMWYNRHSGGPSQGKLLRSWLSIRDTRYLSKEK